ERVAVLLVVVRLQHPRENPAVSAARRAPPARRIEREILRVELGKTLARFDVGARRREPRENLALFREQKTGSLAETKSVFESLRRLRAEARLRCLASGFGLCALGFQICHHDLHIVLLVAIEFLEGVDAREFPVGAHQREALLPDPRGDGLVVALASA